MALIALALLAGAFRLIAPGAFLTAEVPLLRTGDFLSGTVKNFSNGFKNAQFLANENDSLATQNQQLGEENALLSAKIADLTTLIGAVPQPALGIAAGVIARPPESPYDTLVVGAGSDSGVVVGDAVYSAGGIPLGVVENVSSGYARVALLSAGGMRSDAWLGNAHEPLTLVGQGGGALSAQVPRSASTTTGEEIYVGGPGSLPIGSVASAGGDPSAPFLTLYIKGSVNPAALTYVLIRSVPPAWNSLAATSTAL
ncbi:MAG: rod shape-determining protein MreC [Minisyncoccia bacterium]